ncbi:hypothetical protein BH23PAT1_BH23PAT1_1360 [soil metagenome]
MIQNIEVTGIHFDVSDDLNKYAVRKIGKLDRFIPKHARESARAEILLKESKSKNKKSCTCEVILHLPHEKLTTHESTMNIFAAIDIVEAKLKNQLKKYKETHTHLKFHRRVLARMRRTG